MQIRYFQTAWGDIKNSPGWFGKLCLLALLNIIPVFGQIVTFAFLYGWAREMAWGVHRPLPDSLFANDDGKFWRRGWFLFVISFVFSLVPAIVMGIGGSMMGSGLASIPASGLVSGSAHAPAAAAGGVVAAGAGGFVYFVGWVLSLVISLFIWVAFMRASVYDRLSAGFQLGKIWKMMRHDGGGILRIFGMNLLVGFILGVVLSLVCGVVALILLALGFGSVGSLHDGAAPVVLGLLGVGSVFFIAVAYFAMVASMFVEMLVARAMGYWVMQFDVPRWGGQDDPMPFELVAQAPANQRPDQPFYTAPASAQGQAAYGAGAQPQPFAQDEGVPYAGAQGAAQGTAQDVAPWQGQAPAGAASASSATFGQPAAGQPFAGEPEGAALPGDLQGAHGVQDGQAGDADIAEYGQPHGGDADEGQR